MRVAVGLAMLGLAGWAWGQAPAKPAAPDAGVAAAEVWVGRALILRQGDSAGELDFDAAGKLKKPGKAADWTLSGFSLGKVSRRPDGELELEGMRVAARYNPDQHGFERHVLKDKAVRVVFPAGSAADVDREMAAIFATGIDPALERAMPPYWSHYFVPSLVWVGDGLVDKDIVRANGKLPDGGVLPLVEKKGEPGYTDEARADKVKGTVQLLIVVDQEGVPRRITVRQPLGYGLDERTAESVGKWRFQPGTVKGVPTAMEVVVNQGFEFVATP